MLKSLDVELLQLVNYFERFHETLPHEVKVIVLLTLENYSLAWLFKFYNQTLQNFVYYSLVKSKTVLPLNYRVEIVVCYLHSKAR